MMEAQSRRVDATEAALAGTVVERQLQASFGDLRGTNPFVAAGFRVAPLLLLKPEKRGGGFGAFASDPRVVALALVAGLTVVSEFRRKTQDIRITYAPQAPLALGAKFRVRADGSNGLDGSRLKWESSNEDVVVVDKEGGVVTAKAAGVADIKVTDGKDYDVVTVQVAAPQAAAAQPIEDNGGNE